jgi:hypothetical protein
VAQEVVNGSEYLVWFSDFDFSRWALPCGIVTDACRVRIDGYLIGLRMGQDLLWKLKAY